MAYCPRDPSAIAERDAADIAAFYQFAGLVPPASKWVDSLVYRANLSRTIQSMNGVI